MKASTGNRIIVGVGLLLACLVPAVVFAVLTPIHRGDFSFVQFRLVPVFFPFSVVAITIVGAPLYFFLRAFHLVNLWTALLAGCIGGALVGVVLRWPGYPSPSELIVLCPTGAASGFLLWLTLRATKSSE
jgi:hypothetical protein